MRVMSRSDFLFPRKESPYGNQKHRGERHETNKRQHDDVPIINHRSTSLHYVLNFLPSSHEYEHGYKGQGPHAGEETVNPE